MPNVNAARGLIALRHYNGGEVRMNTYYIANGLAVNIGTGDPVKSTGTGKQITRCAATDAAIGVFQGCRYVDPTGEIRYSAQWISGTQIKAGSVVEAMVYDDPNIVFEIQASLAFTAADIGAQASYAVAEPDTATGVSRFALDSATLTASNVTPLALKVVDIVPRPDNAVGNYAKLQVLLNKHELLSNTRLAV